jgi:SAM-dependent methyltransferase
MSAPPDGRHQIDRHNRFQQHYFEGSIQRTIAPTASRHLNRQLDETLRFGSVTPHDRVLEIGCGMGRCTLLMAERGVGVEGLDLSPSLLDRLRSHNGGRYQIPLHCADVRDPPAELLGMFDVVLGILVLHHLTNLEECFAAMARLLKPGGRLVLLEANAYNPLFYVQIALTPGMTWQGDKGIAQMRPPRVFDAMKSAGLGRFEMTRFGFLPASVADCAWGAAVDAVLERVPIWRVFLPFQLFRAERI